MSNYYFYNAIDSYVVLFHKLLKDLRIKRIDKTTGTIPVDVRVPIFSENKAKAYIYSNKNLETVGAKLPIIGISEPKLERVTDKNKLPNKGEYLKDKESAGVMHFVKNPLPYKFTFYVTVWCKYARDMRQLNERLIGDFGDFVVQPMNVMPELSLYLEIPIRLVGEVSDESVFESETIAPEDRVLRKTFEFELYGYIFKETQIKSLIKRTVLRSDELRFVSELMSSPNDLVDETISSFVNVNEGIITNWSYTATEARNNVTIEETITSYISTYGETLEVRDGKGNILPYVFQYSNMEYYSNDDALPSFRTGLTKTGKIAFKVNLDAGENNVYLYYIADKSYYYGEEVFEIYRDFNKRRFDILNVVNKTEADYTYISNGALITRCFPQSTVVADVKVIPDYSISTEDREFFINFMLFSAPTSGRLCGLLDENGNYLYLDYLYRLVTRVGSTETVLTTFTTGLPTVDLRFKVVKRSNSYAVTVGGSTYTFTSALNFVNMFVCGARSIFYIESMYSKRIL